MTEAEPQSSRRQQLTRIAAALALLTLVTALFALFSTGTAALPWVLAPPGRRLDVVLAHYAEPPERVAATLRDVQRSLRRANLQTRAFVYTKGDAHTAVRLASVAGAPFPLNVTALENVGREGDAFLTYILDHYAALPDYVLFSQAAPNLEKVFHQRLVRWARSRHPADVVGLCGVARCTCDGCFHQNGSMVRMREVYAMATQQLCQPFMAYMNGEFLVSREAIRLQTPGFYALMRAMLHTPPDGFIHKDLEKVVMYEGFEKGELNNNSPLFLHVLERAWAIIFGCADGRSLCTP